MKPTASSTPSLSSNNTIEYNTIQHINTIFWRKKGWQLNYPLYWTPQKTALFSCKNREWKEKQRRLNVPINPTNHCFASAIIDFHVRSLLLSYISLIYYHLLWYIPSVATHQPHTIITIASSVLQTTSIRFSIEDLRKKNTHEKSSLKKFDRLEKALTFRIENLAINLLQANECHFLDEIKRLNRTMGFFLGIAIFFRVFVFMSMKWKWPAAIYWICRIYVRTSSIDRYTFCEASHFSKPFGKEKLPQTKRDEMRLKICAQYLTWHHE